MKQRGEQLYTVSFILEAYSVRIIIVSVLLRYYCIPIIIFKKKFKGRRLIKIFGHSLFALCLCLFPLARLFKTRATTGTTLGQHFTSVMETLVVWIV